MDNEGNKQIDKEKAELEELLKENKVEDPDKKLWCGLLNWHWRNLGK